MHSTHFVTMVVYDIKFEGFFLVNRIQLYHIFMIVLNSHLYNHLHTVIKSKQMPLHKYIYTEQSTINKNKKIPNGQSNHKSKKHKNSILELSRNVNSWQLIYLKQQKEEDKSCQINYIFLEFMHKRNFS